MISLRAEVNPLVLPLSMVAGVLMALCIGVAVRMETGYPPGAPPLPFAKLLGKPAPSFELKSLDGMQVSSQTVSANSDWLLFFTNSGCGACDAAYPALKKVVGQLPVIVVGIGDRQVLRDKLAQNEISAVVAYDSLRTVQRIYGVNNYPSALLIDAQGVVRQGSVGSKSIEQVIATRYRDEEGGV